MNGEKRTFLLLLAILFVGCVIRFYGIDFGLPALYHPDEATKARVLEGMERRESLNPHYFLHPGILLYASMPVRSTLEIIQSPYEGRPQIVLAGRIVSAIAGSLSIVVIFLIAQAIFSSGAGLLAALLLAVNPLHVTCSRYFKEDTLFVLFALLCVVGIVTSVRSARPRKLLWAGAAAGLAAGTKYPGAICIAMLMLAPFYASAENPEQRRRMFRAYLRHAIFAALVAALLFCLTNPFVILSWKEFLRHVAIEVKHAHGGHVIPITVLDSFGSYHLSRSLLPGMTAPLLITAACAIGAGLRSKMPGAYFLIFFAAAFYTIAELSPSKPFPQFDRYMLPVVPPLIALASGFLAHMLPASILGSILIPLIVIFPLTRSLVLARDLEPDTRKRMSEWIAAQIPPGSKIMLDGTYVPRLRGLPFITADVRVEKAPAAVSLSKLQGNGFDYFLTTSFTYDRHLKHHDAPRSYRKRYETLFSRLELQREEKASSGTYGFHNPVVRLYRVPSSKEAASE